MDVKTVIRHGLAAPGVRHGLRWFMSAPGVPDAWRHIAYRKLAKRARFGDDSTFQYTTPEGVRLRLLHRGAAISLYWRNEYEPETTRLFCEHARTADVILDIGAAHGIYAMLAAAANPRARIFAFEPGEQTSRECRRNLELNHPITANVELLDLALGDSEATTTLYVAGAFGGTSSLNPSFRPNAREQQVRVRRGDTLLDEAGVRRVDLIKLDTESTEPAVLRGLTNVLRRDHPKLLVEVLHGRTERDLEQILGPLGYRYYWVGDRGLTRTDTINGDPTYRYPNYFFTTE